MDWKYFGAGVGFLAIAYLDFRVIQRRKRNPGKKPVEGLISVLDVEYWGMLILCLIGAAAYNY